MKTVQPRLGGWKMQSHEHASTQATAASPARDTGPALPPTEKQLLYARRIASRSGSLLPWDVQQDRQSLSRWIDTHAHLGAPTTAGQTHERAYALNRRSVWPKNTNWGLIGDAFHKFPTFIARIRRVNSIIFLYKDFMRLPCRQPGQRPARVPGRSGLPRGSQNASAPMCRTNVSAAAISCPAGLTATAEPAPAPDMGAV